MRSWVQTQAQKINKQVCTLSSKSTAALLWEISCRNLESKQVGTGDCGPCGLRQPWGSCSRGWGGLSAGLGFLSTPYMLFLFMDSAAQRAPESLWYWLIWAKSRSLKAFRTWTCWVHLQGQGMVHVLAALDHKKPLLPSSRLLETCGAQERSLLRGLCGPPWSLFLCVLFPSRW